MEKRKARLGKSLAIQGINVVTVAAQGVAEAIGAAEPNTKILVIQALLAAILPGLDAWLARRRAKLAESR